jgi:ankyrin repeat and BTB/POZ domain-containing protein 1
MVLRKDQLEASLHEEKKLIQNGLLKDDNPLDFSEPFRRLCLATRRGDLKGCQEAINDGANINARDEFDYTPLILVSNVNFYCYTTQWYLNGS